MILPTLPGGGTPQCGGCMGAPDLESPPLVLRSVSGRWRRRGRHSAPRCGSVPLLASPILGALPRFGHPGVENSIATTPKTRTAPKLEPLARRSRPPGSPGTHSARRAHTWPTGHLPDPQGPPALPRSWRRGGLGHRPVAPASRTGQSHRPVAPASRTGQSHRSVATAHRRTGAPAHRRTMKGPEFLGVPFRLPAPPRSDETHSEAWIEH